MHAGIIVRHLVAGRTTICPRSFARHTRRGTRPFCVSTASLASGRLGYGQSYAEEEFELAERRLKLVEDEVPPSIKLQLKAYKHHASGLPIPKAALWSQHDMEFRDLVRTLEGLSRYRARDEYITLVTQLWEQKEVDHRTYRRDSTDDTRGLFRVRTKEALTMGSDAHIIGSGDLSCGEEFLYEEIEDGVQTIWFNNPLRDNRLNLSMLAAFPKLLKKASQDPDVFATVLTGQGECYCGGIDADMLQAVVDGSRTQDPSWKAKLVEFRNLLENYVSAFIQHDKPLVAAVNGRAEGLGTTTLALCDLVFSSEMATIHVPASQLATSTDGCASYTFPRIMGNAVASDILLRGARQMVQTAHDNGLVTHIMDELDTVHHLERVLYRISTLQMKSLLESRHLMRSYDREMLLAVNKGECDATLERWQKEETQEFLQRYLAGKRIELLQPSVQPRKVSPFAVRGALGSKKLPKLPESEHKNPAALPSTSG